MIRRSAAAQHFGARIAVSSNCTAFRAGFAAASLSMLQSGSRCSSSSAFLGAPTPLLLARKAPASPAAGGKKAGKPQPEAQKEEVVEETAATPETKAPAGRKKGGTASDNSNATEQQQQQEGGGNSSNGESSSSSSAGNSAGGSVVPSSGTYIPATGTVSSYSEASLKREGRFGIIEAPLWTEDSLYHPILTRGKKNVYEHTDDIPLDVKPMMGETQIWQTREYFHYRRNAEKLRYRFLYLGSGLFVFFGLAGAVAFTRIWVDQPSEVATLRRSLLGNAYGRVLELAAGQGINIGVYPFAVTDVVLVDYNPQELHILRSRLPRTAYPSYQVVCDRAEELRAFPDHCFDTVVDMFGLCHYKDPVLVLTQMQRVCKPTGQILLLEHGRSTHWWVNWFLDYKASNHYEATQGCQWNKDLRALFQEAGLVVRSIDTQHYGTTHIVIAHPKPPEVDLPLMAGGAPATPVQSTVVPKYA